MKLKSLFRLNREQRITLVIGAIVLGLVWLYPPFDIPNSGGLLGDESAYSFFASPPPGTRGLADIEVDALYSESFLVFEVFTIILIILRDDAPLGQAICALIGLIAAVWSILACFRDGFDGFCLLYLFAPATLVLVLVAGIPFKKLPTKR